MRKTSLTDEILLAAIEEMEHGLIDAQLGGNLFKKRIAFPGQGKRGSARTIVATRERHRWFFMYGFEKNESDNISPDELEVIKQAAEIFLSNTAPQLNVLVKDGFLFKVVSNE